MGLWDIGIRLDIYVLGEVLIVVVVYGVVVVEEVGGGVKGGEFG